MQLPVKFFHGRIKNTKLQYADLGYWEKWKKNELWDKKSQI